MYMFTLSKFKGMGLICGLILLTALLCGTSARAGDSPDVTEMDSLVKLRQLASQFSILLMQDGEPLSEKEKDEVKEQFERLLEKQKAFEAALEEGKEDKIAERDGATNPKTIESLNKEIDKINVALEATNIAINTLTQALENLQTLTKEAARLALEVVTESAKVAQAVTEAITGTAKAIIKGALDIFKAALQAAAEALKGILGLLKDILKFAAGFLKDLWGIFTFADQVDLGVEGTHTLNFGPDSYFNIYLPSFQKEPITIYFTNLSFDVTSVAGSTTNLFFLTIDSGTFAGSLEPFMAGPKNIGPSTLELEPAITWTGIYDSQDESIYLTIGGVIINDYTTEGTPMIFSAIVEGYANGSLHVSGSIMEPFYLLPALTEWGFAALAFIIFVAGIWIILKRKRQNIAATN